MTERLAMVCPLRPSGVGSSGSGGERGPNVQSITYFWTCRCVAKYSSYYHQHGKCITL
jgi:hypothetical protein